jgi:hypothetical protein
MCNERFIMLDHIVVCLQKHHGLLVAIATAGLLVN